jgi:hypothetical protein
MVSFTHEHFRAKLKVMVCTSIRVGEHTSMQVHKMNRHKKSRARTQAIRVVKTWSYRMRDPPLERAMVPSLTNPPELKLPGGDDGAKEVMLKRCLP